MNKGTKIAIAVFAAVLLYMFVSPYMYGNNGQPKGSTSPEQPAFPQVTPDGLFIPFASVTALLGVIGLAAKFG